MMKKGKGWTWKTVGKQALKIGLPMGKLACPHCGTLCSGVIEETCPWCDRKYFNKQKEVICNKKP